MIRLGEWGSNPCNEANTNLIPRTGVEVESCTLNEVHSLELGGPIEKDLMDSPTKERLSL